jgi:uncharacterized protein YkwD
LRVSVIVVVLLCGLFPELAGAQTTGASSVTVSHPTLALGQAETITVVARDLAGRPLPNAAVTIVVRFGTRTVTYHPKHTDGAGRTSLSFHAPSGLSSGKIPVLVTISNGYLRQTLGSRFALSSRAIVPSSTSTPHAPISPTPTATGVPNGLTVTASALPPTVTAPNPIYVVVNARYHNLDQPGAAVVVTTSFKEGKVVTNGTTDTYGVATVRIDTAHALVTQVVKVVAAVTWHGVTTRNTTLFNVTAAPATAIPTVAAQTAPTFTPTPTVLAPGPGPSPTPTETPTDVPTATPYPTPTPYPTATEYPTPTPTPFPTDTPIPTNTPIPSPTPTPLPTNTPTQTPNCPGSQTGCMQAMLNIINTTRSQAGLYPLVLNTVQSNGTSTCVGSYGHSLAMAQSGNIWHDNSAYPAASFPNNICVATSSAAENVGQFSSGNELNDLQQIHNLMMNEPHDAATCASQINHACNLLNAKLHQVGIGIYYNAGRTWLTEDFLG